MPAFRNCHVFAASTAVWVSSHAIAATPPSIKQAEPAPHQAYFEAVINDGSRSLVNPPPRCARLRPAPPAMRLFRFGTLPVSENLLFLPQEVRQRARSAAEGDDPPIAPRFEVTGATRATVLLDATGRVLEVQITGRRLNRPGLAPGRVSVAFEPFSAAAVPPRPAASCPSASAALTPARAPR